MTDRGRGWTVAFVAVGVVAVLALVLGSLALGAGGDDGDVVTSAGKSAPSIVVTGDGSVTGVPDELAFTARVSVTRSDVAAAMEQASRSMKQVFAAVGRHGVKKADMQTTGVSVRPSYDYSGNTRRLVGYHATQTARIKVDDLRKAGKALSAAAGAAGDDVRISGVGLDIADRDGLLADARKAAVADAEQKAEEYARAGGRDLGRLLSVKEVSTAAPEPQRMPYAAAGRLANLDAAVPVSAGTRDLKVRVRVVWALDR